VKVTAIAVLFTHEGLSGGAARAPITSRAVAVRQSVRIVVGMLAVVGALTACGGSGLTVGGLDQQVAPALTGSTGPCPVPYDVAAAATSSGIAGDVAPADTDPVSAETSDSPEAGDFLKQVGPAVDLECDYRVGQTDVTTYLVATSKANSAVSALLPEVAFLSGGDPGALDAVVVPIMSTEPGTAVPVPGGKAAVVRLDVQDGDGAFVVGVDPADGISPSQLASFAETLAGQLA
jgi:hypothetical protein